MKQKEPVALKDYSGCLRVIGLEGREQDGMRETESEADVKVHDSSVSYGVRAWIDRTGQ